MADTKVIDLVKKLLNLAHDKAATPAEAAVAASKAADLLARHNLTVAEVEATTGQQAEDYVRQDMPYGGRKTEESWRVLLAHAVARTNFCRMVNIGYAHSAGFVGKPSNIEVCQYLYTYLATTVVRLADEGWKALEEAPTRQRWQRGRWTGDTFKQSGYRDVKVAAATWKRAFCLGAVDIVRTRLDSERRAFANQTPQTNALVLTSERELALAYKHEFPRTTTRSRGSHSSSDAFAAGQRAGAGIAINKGVGSRATPTGVRLLNAG